MTLWVRRKKPVKSVIALDPEDIEGAQDIGGNTGNNYIRVQMPFNSLMTEFFLNFLKAAIWKSRYIICLCNIYFKPRMPEIDFLRD